MELFPIIAVAFLSALCASLFTNNRALRGQRSDELRWNAKALVEMKRQVRRERRERAKWEAEATRIMGMRLNRATSVSPGEPQQARKGRVVGPAEAIKRERERQAEFAATMAPPQVHTSRVPPVIRAKFLKEAKNGKTSM